MSTSWAGRRLLPVLAAAAMLTCLAGGVHAQVHGAVFTTDIGGSTNINLYDSKLDVYVNGGPRKLGSAGLPLGFYHIQVTSPNGADVLGSSWWPEKNVTTPPIEVVESSPGAGDGHFLIVYRLWNVVKYIQGNGPNCVKDGYKDTTNNGGEYKIWVQHADGFNGFVSSVCKTDNFKVRKGPPIPAQVGIEAFKFRDTNGNAQWDEPEELPIENWTIELVAAGTNQVVQTQQTDAGGKVSFLVNQEDVNYIVREVMQPNWVNTTPLQSGLLNAMTDHVGANAFEFGNWVPIDLCVEKFRDSNGNGTLDAGEAPINGWEFDLYAFDAGLNDWVFVDTATTGIDGKACHGPVDADGTLYEWREDLTGGWAVTNGSAARQVTAELNPVTPMFLNWMPMNIDAYKFYDQNEDGAKQGSEQFIPGWKIELRTTGDVVLETEYTDVNGRARFIVDTDDTQYKVVEIMPADSATVYWFNTTDLSETITANGDKVIEFGNVAKEPVAVTGYGRTLGFWHNNNGSAMLEPHFPAWANELNALCLRKSNGDDLVLPTTSHADAHAVLAPWLTSQSSASNMANMMSVQFTAIYLNTRFGPLSAYTDLHVMWNGNLVPLQDLFDDANDILCGDGVIENGHPKFAEASTLKNFFDAMNNSQTFGLGIPVYAWQVLPPVPAFSYPS